MPAKDPRRQPFVVLDDAFQTVAPGEAPFVGDGDRGWKVIRPRPELAQVLAEGANRFLELKRDEGDAPNGGEAWVTMLPQDAADTTNGLVEVSATVRVPSTNRASVAIEAYDNPPEQCSNRAFHVRFWPDGSVSHYARIKPEGKAQQYDPDEWTAPTRIDIPTLRFKPDEWCDIAIRADLRAATFDLTVGDKTVTGLTFAHQSVHRIQTLFIGPNGDHSALHVDHLRVGVMP